MTVKLQFVVPVAGCQSLVPFESVSCHSTATTNRSSLAVPARFTVELLPRDRNELAWSVPFALKTPPPALTMLPAPIVVMPPW